MGEKKNQAASASDQTTAHKALYRKYRSRSLDEIKGQEHITKTLKNAIEQGKVNHAYLFTGPRGTGKTSVARILAHEINNIPYDDEKPHLDIIEIDAASNRRIDDIRDLRDKVHIAPLSAKYKVYIIDEVHMLTNESFNALLKTLEEPPEHVIFILATTEAHKLPATIISRTQRHSFRLIEEAKVKEHLSFIAKQEGISIDDGALEVLAQHGGGSFRDSISLLDQLSSNTEKINKDLVEVMLGLAPEDALDSLLKAINSGDLQAVLQKLEELLAIGLTPSGVANQLLQKARTSIKQSGRAPINAQLMNELLGVHNAQYPKLKLETTLLGAASLHTAKSSYPTTQKPIRQEEVKQPKAGQTYAQKNHSEQNLKKTAKTQPQKMSHKTDSSKKEGKQKPETPAPPVQNEKLEEAWPTILNTIKVRNNPLYTVLRLATPEVTDEGLLLIFGFPFHQKKVEEIRYKSLISEVVAEITGNSLQVQTVVDKSRAQPVYSSSASPKESARASLISNIQDIMGGGEVVDV